MQAGKYFAGVDFGQANDWSALVVLQVIESPKIVEEEYILTTAAGSRVIKKRQANDKPAPTEYHVRHVERWRAEPYDRIVDHIKRRVERLERCTLAVDFTGVGRACYDLMIEHGLRSVTPITIHGGNQVTRDGLGFGVPKRDLVGQVAVGLHTKTLKIAAGVPEAVTLTEELKNFKVKISTDGRDTYSAWRERDHDDTVLALACALWLAVRQSSGGVATVPMPSAWRR